MVILPREEEPQIRVPVVDILLAMPGASAAEVESRISAPLERLMWEIPGVEYVYSTSEPGRALIVVRYRVGQNTEQSLVKLYQKLQAHPDRLPPEASPPLVKARSVDDVPILALTFHSKRYDHLTLRRVAAQVDAEIKHVPEVSETTLIGGYRRQIRLHLDPAALAARGLGVLDVLRALGPANRQEVAGALTTADRDLIVQTGAFFTSADDVTSAVVGVHAGNPVYLRDVAEVRDDSEEPTQYVLFGTGAATHRQRRQRGARGHARHRQAAGKQCHRRGPGRAGTDRASEGHGDSPRRLRLDHAGTTERSAAEKSNELLLHMAIALVGVSLLVLFLLGWRESVVVAVAIPSTLALMLLVFFLLGYTLNRITLFAMIFSIGILVDDAIVVVENIVRHRDLPGSQRRSLREIAVEAVAEVGNPTVLATLTVIAAILPMAFVGGLSGPYLRPIPVGASVAMVFSLLVAFVVTPWAAARLLRSRGEGHGPREGREDRAPGLTAGSCPGSSADRSGAGRSWAGSASSSSGAMAFVPAGWVRVKMLPFDNKSELEIVLNMPEDSSLERTAQVAREIAAAIRQEKEVTDYQVYVGTAAPYSFNGLMRHYYLRQGSSVAEVQVNLLPKHQRSVQSHGFALRIRPAVAAIAARHGARVAVAEVPPGPPVLQTLVAEVYGPDRATRRRLAERMRALFLSTPAVVDVDWYVESPHPKEVPRRRQGEGRPSRHHRRQRRPDTPRRGERRVGRAACTCRMTRRTSTSWSTCLGCSEPQLADLLAIQLPDGRGQSMVPLSELVRVRAPRRTGASTTRISCRWSTSPVTSRAAPEARPTPFSQMNKTPSPRFRRRAGRRLQLHPATQRCTTGHQVGRRMAHHARALPRPRRGAGHRPPPHLRPAGGLVSFLPDASHRHGGHPLLPGGDPPGARWPWERSSPRRR